MLNFRSTNIAFTSMLLLAIALDVKFGIPWFVFLILAAAYGLLLFYGCYYIGSNYFVRVVCAADTREKVIAISFDDGPDGKNTPLILQILREHHAEAAFFLIGSKIHGNEVLVLDTVSQGHLVGNHSFSHHFWFDLFPFEKMAADLGAADGAISAVTGKRPKLFRPPYGVTNPTVKKVITAGNYIPVGWSVRSYDTVIKDEKKLLNKLTARISAGAIFLFHDTSDTTVAILPSFLNHVKSRGYAIVRLDKMLNLQPYA